MYSNELFMRELIISIQDYFEMQNEKGKKHFLIKLIYDI